MKCTCTGEVASSPRVSVYFLYNIIGVSESEPHTSGFNVRFSLLMLYRRNVRRL